MDIQRTVTYTLRTVLYVCDHHMHTVLYVLYVYCVLCVGLVPRRDNLRLHKSFIERSFGRSWSCSAGMAVEVRGLLTISQESPLPPDMEAAGENTGLRASAQLRLHLLTLFRLLRVLPRAVLS